MTIPEIPYLTSGAFHYKNGSLYADQVDLYELSREVGTPSYVYSRDRIVANYKRLKNAFPNADLHYSLKANANQAIIKELIDMGAGMDAVSGGEIYRALHAGAKPEQIVFAGVGKTDAEIKYGLAHDLAWFNVESDQELELLARRAKEMEKKARVALRLNPNVQADTHPHISTGHAAAKFGIELAQAPALLKHYANSDSISIEGIHLHIGSQLGSVSGTVSAVQSVVALFRAYPQLKHLNVGGGFPVSYVGESVPSVEEFAMAIRAMLGGLELHLMIEPGRYLMADAGVLLVEVQYVKPTPDGTLVIVDGGMSELIRPALYDAVHGVLPVRERSAAEWSAAKKTHVVGPLCESGDVLRMNANLAELKHGDILAICHVGAYGSSMGSNYNSRPFAPEVLVRGAEWEKIRRRQRLDELTFLERLTLIP